MEKSLCVRFSSGEVERVLSVSRCQRLMNLQEGLCGVFHARFPAKMAVITTAVGKRFEDFETVPFEDVLDEIVEVLARVEFLPTDNPYFYDVRDRCGRNVSLEKEMRWEEARRNGTVGLDLYAWIKNERLVAKESFPTPVTRGCSGWGLGGPPVIECGACWHVNSGDAFYCALCYPDDDEPCLAASDSGHHAHAEEGSAQSTSAVRAVEAADQAKNGGAAPLTIASQNRAGGSNRLHYKIEQVHAEVEKLLCDAGASKHHAKDYVTHHSPCIANQAGGSNRLQKHANGPCTPCLFYFGGTGCKNGANCEYCHICGPDSLQLGSDSRFGLESRPKEKKKLVKKRAKESCPATNEPEGESSLASCVAS